MEGSLGIRAAGVRWPGSDAEAEGAQGARYRLSQYRLVRGRDASLGRGYRQGAIDRRRTDRGRGPDDISAAPVTSRRSWDQYSAVQHGQSGHHEDDTHAGKYILQVSFQRLRGRTAHLAS